MSSRLQKGFGKPIKVINKVDRPMLREKGEVENEIFDIFAAMASNDDQPRGSRQ